MSTSYDDWNWEPDYTQVKYTDNCICYIPMYDKNDLYDKVGKHNFRIYNLHTGDNANNIEEEDVHMLPTYYEELVRVKNTTTNSTTSASATKIINYMLGKGPLDADGTYGYFYNGSGPQEGFCYDGEGGFKIPSLSDSSLSFSCGLTSTSLNKSDYKYKYVKGMSSSCTSKVRTVIEPNPLKVNNPDTGVPYDTLCIKLEIWYKNGHYYLANHENSDFTITSTTGKHGMATRLYDQKSLFIMYTTKATSTTAYNSTATTNGSSGVPASGNDGSKWHILTTIVKRENIIGSGSTSTGYGGYVKSYFNNEYDYAGFGLSSGTRKLLHETSTSTLSYDCYNPSFYNNFTVAAAYSKADRDKKSCNKNYIRKLQIFHGEKYAYTATEPVYTLKYDPKYLTKRIVADQNELKNRLIKCYEYR